VKEITEVTLALEFENHNDVGLSNVTLIIYLSAESAVTCLLWKQRLWIRYTAEGVGSFMPLIILQIFHTFLSLYAHK